VFERAWTAFSARRTEADYEAWRRDRASHAWKYAMWDAGCKLPTQTADRRSLLWRGDWIEDMDQHIYPAHIDKAA
jgi:hypothetical protein